MQSPPRLLLPAALALLALILVVAIVLGNSSKGSSTSPSGSTTPQPVAGFNGAVLPPGLHAPGFTLTDQNGRTTSLSAYRGRVVVLAFLSSSCRACALVAQQVRGALDELASSDGGPKGGAPGPVAGVETLFVSTNPSADTRSSVARFLAGVSLGGRVDYLTAGPTQLQRVWRSYGIAAPSRGKAASEAATSVLLIDRHGVERVEFGLEQLTPEDLAHDIRRLLSG